jgi:SAM-dependent methyltransferase
MLARLSIVLLLKTAQRSKLDLADDALFYDQPRFVTHVDENFIDQLTQLYRDRLAPEMQVLDLMSSWVSHLPGEMRFARVEGHGLNADELAKNQRLDHYFVQNLNQNQALPYGDQHFDAVLITVSVQYLEQPEAVFAEIYRILKPGGVVIVSYSNRMFYQKAIEVWRDGSEKIRVALVERYFENAGFERIETIARISSQPPMLQLFGFGASDPFYATIGYRSAA